MVSRANARQIACPRCTAVGSLWAGGSALLESEGMGGPASQQSPVPFTGWPGALAPITLKKLECSKQAETWPE